MWFILFNILVSYTCFAVLLFIENSSKLFSLVVKNGSKMSRNSFGVRELCQGNMQIFVSQLQLDQMNFANENLQVHSFKTLQRIMPWYCLAV